MHQRTRIKVCGLTSPGDAAIAVAAGVDAVGVVFAPSTRQVSVEQAAEILAGVPPFVARVGVFVDAPPDFVEAAVAAAGLTAVQFHGDETPDQCACAPVPAIKVFRVGTGFDVSDVEPFRGLASAVLLDTHDSHAYGGTGKAFNWQDVAALPDWAPSIVAGGLTPTNVGAAIKLLRPFAVDVSSGVEERPGRKDPRRIADFVAAVRVADAEVTP